MSQPDFHFLKNACVGECEFRKSGEVLTIFLEEEDLIQVVKTLRKNDYFIEDVTGLDVAEGFLVLYHFDHFRDPGRISLRVLLLRENPVIPSIASIYHGAEWHERETSDFYGIIFEGNPNPAPLLLPDDGTPPPLIKTDEKRAGLYKVKPFHEFVHCPEHHPLVQKLHAATADNDEGEQSK